MSFYKTCRNCAFEHTNCARRASLAASIKGLGLTAVKFRCALRRPIFRAGQRVTVTWKLFPPDWAYEDGYSLESWPATVVDETRKGFLIAVDDVPSDGDLPARDYIKSESLFCNVIAKRLAPLDEPDRRVCEYKYCRCPENGNGGIAGNCWNASGFDATMVPNCLLASVGRNPKGEDPVEGLRAEHEHAVTPQAGDAQ